MVKVFNKFFSITKFIMEHREYVGFYLPSYNPMQLQLYSLFFFDIIYP